jgi:ferredoxin
MKLEEHPTVQWYRRETRSGRIAAPVKLEASWLKRAALDAGIDDIGIVHIDQPALSICKEEILNTFPKTKTVVSLVRRLNPENIRCVYRSVSDFEFKKGFEEVDAAGLKLVSALREKGGHSILLGFGFPMDLELWPGKMWPVSHKSVAEAAGMGMMGKHRILIHPRFGSFVTLATLLIDCEVDTYHEPLDFNPCIDCGFCSAVCPVGAIGKDGTFNFANCITHNYRDRMGGFIDWVERITESRGALDYRKKVSDPETVSMWQSLSFGISNKSSYCMAACPAGQEMIGPFLEDRKTYISTVVKPLQGRKEKVFVVADTDAESHVTQQFPHKEVVRIGNGLRPKSVRNFMESLPLLFQREKSQGMEASYHFTFMGEEEMEGTVIIRDKKIEILEGHVATADLKVKADSRTWLKFLAKETGIFKTIVTGKIKIKGSPKLLKAFGNCFPL